MAATSLFINLEPDSIWSWLFRISGLVIYFGLISSLLVLFIKLVTHFYKPLLKPLAIAIFSLAQIIVFANLHIHSLYHFHINGMVLNLLFSGALLETIAFSWFMWLSIGFILITLIFAEWGLASWIQKKSTVSYKRRFWILFSLLLIGFILLNGFAEGLGWHWVTNQRAYIPWLPPITMRSHLKRMGFDVQKAPDALSTKSTAINYPLETLHCTNQQPLNLVFLVVDSLRADMMSADIMSFTSQLKTRAQNFNQHYSNANSTRYGMFSLFYGLNGTYWHPMLNAERGSVLFDVTLEKHYQHFIYGSTKLTFPEFDRTIFSSLRDQLKRGSHKNSADNDREITDLLLADIQSRNPNQPFVGFLFFDSAHAFHLPENYPEIFSPRLETVNYLALDDDYDPLPFLNLYKTTAHYVDTQIQRIAEQLEAQQLTDKTLIVITSDHGQEFNETGLNYWGHNGNFSQWQTHVPMLILWPGKAPQTFNHISSHEDLIPTLMQDLFQCSNPIASYSTGQSLFDSHTTNRSLIMETWTERAIYYKQTLYFMDALGIGKTLDMNYQKVDGDDLPAEILQDNMEKISRFLKH
jgi:uncharacterized protein